MSQVGAPLGNQNGRKGKLWSDAIKRAIREKVEGEDWEAKIAKLAGALVDEAKKGELQALKEIGDRLDGKPKQQIEATGEDGGPLKTALTVEYVRPPT